MEGKAMNMIRSAFRNPPLLTLLLVALVWIVASLSLRGFGAYGHLRYLLELAAVIGIAAAGQTLVILMGGIDLSVGAVITVTAILLPLISPAWDPTGLAGIVAALAIATGIGLMNGAGAAYLRVPPIIMTLAMATFLQGLLVIIAGGSAVTVSNPAVILLGQARPLGIPSGIILWLVVSIVVLLLVHRMPIGARFLALGANPLAARLSGVSVTRNTLVGHTLSGFFAGLAGILVLGMNRQGYVGIGDPYLLTSIAAVVLGGTSILGGRGNYLGTVAGVILITLLQSILSVMQIEEAGRQLIYGAVIILMLLIYGRQRKQT
jgi:ribose transport system permease protein